MPKKLTILGALTALVLVTVGVMRDGNAAFAAPVQNFDVDATICYGAEPVDGTFTCPGASGTTAATSDSSAQYTLIDLPTGSRLTLPIVYTPTSFGFSGGAGTIGNVTSATDLLCNSGIEDILASGTDPGDPAPDPVPPPNALDPWPDDDTWIPYDFIHQGVAPAGADAYVTQIKPAPSTFTPLSHDRADLYTLWLNKATPLFLPTLQGGNPTRLNLVTEEVPASYTGGTVRLRAAATLLAGDPGNPPTNSFTLCLDSPQNSVSANTQTTTPAAAGRYARFTAFTSAEDERDGAISRILDLNCVNVGGAAGVDADNDCLTDGDADDAPGADGDGDFVPDGIEKLFGTDETDSDTDNDGSTDFDEIFNFTNPHVTDTDGDGQLDKADNGADDVPGTITVIDDNTSDDNCPSDANATQTNSDSAPDNNGVTGDPTNPSQDTLGDACDTDDDNDGIVDVAEAVLRIDVSPNFCSSSAGALNPTSTTNPDTDADLGLDGVECKYQSNPQSQASVMAAQPVDNLGVQVPPATSDAQETFYRTGAINIPGGGQENNPDGDTATDPVADGDSDNDGLLDGTEVKFYGTHPTNSDSDGDGCSDGREAASVNGDRNVSSIDLGQIAQRFGAFNAAVNPERVDYDYTKNGAIQSADLGQVAQRFGSCPAQGGITVNRGTAGPLP